MMHLNEQETKEGKRLAWMNKELPSLLKCKQEIDRRWKLGWPTWKEYREVVKVGVKAPSQSCLNKTRWSAAS